eukprot:1061-Prymnesium_polylepis.2
MRRCDSIRWARLKAPAGAATEERGAVEAGKAGRQASALTSSPLPPRIDAFEPLDGRVNLHLRYQDRAR